MNRIDEDQGDVDRPADDRRHQPDQDDRPAEVDQHDHAPPVEAVRGNTTQHAEQQHRQVLAEQGHGDEQRVPCQRGDEQGPGREHDAVADVVDDGRRQEPAEAPAKPRRHDGLDGPGREGSHRRQDTNRFRARDGPAGTAITS